LIAAQRDTGVAFAGALKEQLKPSAERPAANAALVALMQNTNSAAAAISIINLMAYPPFGGRGFCTRTRRALPETPLTSRDLSSFGVTISPKPDTAGAAISARSLHKIIPAQCTTIASAVSIAVQGAYHL
jgi:hypothetical protein